MLSCLGCFGPSERSAGLESSGEGPFQPVSAPCQVPPPTDGPHAAPAGSRSIRFQDEAHADLQPAAQQALDVKPAAKTTATGEQQGPPSALKTRGPSNSQVQAAAPGVVVQLAGPLVSMPPSVGGAGSGTASRPASQPQAPPPRVSTDQQSQRNSDPLATANSISASMLITGSNPLLFNHDLALLHEVGRLLAVML